MNAEEYARFYDALTTAESATVKDFEKEKFFEGCLPIEVMAHRGRDTLRFGPMKPAGPHRSADGTLSVCGGAVASGQSGGRALQPGRLPDAIEVGRAGARAALDSRARARGVRALRDGHRNTYINGPTVLRETWQTKARPDLLFAGQVSGVEGYVESAASGLIAGINAARLALGEEPLAAPRTTAIGALGYYVSHADPANYQPTNIAFGIIPPLEQQIRSRAHRKTAISERALRDLAGWLPAVGRAIHPRRLVRAMDALPENLKEHLKAFLSFLALNRNVSEHTVRAYDSDLTSSSPTSPRRPAASVSTCSPTISTIRRCEDSSPSCTPAATAARRRPARCRRCARSRSILRREGVLDSDPGALIGSPKREQKIPNHLGVSEMDRLLETPDTTNPLGRRDRAILELFYASGLRLSELVGLDLQDVNLSTRMVRVLGKGRKERIVPFNRSTADALKTYLRDREALASGAVFEQMRAARRKTPRVAERQDAGRPRERGGVTTASPCS